MRLLIAAAAFIATGASAAVVPNGNFEAGNSGFTSAYNFGPNQNDLSTFGAGYYNVASDAQFTHPSFTSFGDHTTGSGRYLVANGATTPNTTVYASSSIGVIAGRNYSFGGFFANAFPASPAVIDFRVSLNGGAATSIGTYTIANGSGVWNGAAYSFATGTATSAVLSFVDTNLDGNGNDFGIDDVSLSLTAVPEPATWGLMIAGFAMVGVAARRRRTAFAA